MNATQTAAATYSNEITYLMHTNTGSVDAAENWAAEGFTEENTPDLIVVALVDGEWVAK